MALFAIGCPEAHQPISQVVVVIDAEAGVRAEASHVRVRVEAGTTGALSPRFEGIEPTDAWPLRLTLLPLEDDATRVYRVTAEALDGPEPRTATIVATARVLSGFRPARTLVIHLLFEDCCRGRACGEAETCRMCDCVPAEIDPLTLPELDAGVPLDAGDTDGLDASGVEDVLDTHGWDSGSPDAPDMNDAAMDGGVDAPDDAGVDGGRDGGSDAGAPPPCESFVMTASRARGLSADGYDLSWSSIREGTLGSDRPGPYPRTLNCGVGSFDAYLGSGVVASHRFYDGSGRLSASVARTVVEFPPSPLPPGARVARAWLVLPRDAEISTDRTPIDLHVVPMRSGGADLSCSDYELSHWGVASWGSFASAELVDLGAEARIPLGAPAVAQIEARRPLQLGVRAGADLEDREPGIAARAGTYNPYFVSPNCGTMGPGCRAEEVRLEVECAFVPPPTCPWDAPFETLARVDVDVAGATTLDSLSAGPGESELWIGARAGTGRGIYSLRRPGDSAAIRFADAGALTSHGTPFVSRDGLSLYWAASSSGVPGDLYVATRTDPSEAFGAPTALSVNTAAVERSPWHTSRGLYFERDGEIYFAPSSGVSFGTPVVLGVSGGGTDRGRPVVSDDELTIYFAEASGAAGREIMAAHRESASAPFGAARRLGGLPSHDAVEDAPTWISPDQCRAFVIANGELFLATRLP